MIFLSSLVPSPSTTATTTSSSVSSDDKQKNPNTEEVSAEHYLLIGQGDVAIGKFGLTGDAEEDKKTEKMLVDALPGGLSIIGVLRTSPSTLPPRSGLRDIVLNPEEKVKTFEAVSEKFVVLCLVCPKLLVDTGNVAVPDTFMFSDSLGVGSATSNLLSNEKSLADAPPVVTVKPLYNVMDGFSAPSKDGPSTVSVSLNVVCYILRAPDLTVGKAAHLVRRTLEEKITRGVSLMDELSAELAGLPLSKSFTVASFPMASLCVTACFPCSEYALSTKTCTDFRRRVQAGFTGTSGPQMHPLYSLEVDWGADSRKSGSSNSRRRGFVPLRNVHEQAVDTKTSRTHGTLHFVKGDYDYYHYMQGGFNDSGWGCAYRSMQTLCSWLRCGGYTQKQVPRHRDIQKTLAEIGDKPFSFVGSQDWIGAIEISLCLQRMYGVESRILNMGSGEDIVNYAREIANHFDENGSPIMVGGGVLAYTIIGIDWNKETKEVEFLILDPHYTGLDNPQTIKSGGWCAWKKPSLFKKEHFYNLCMPIKPNIV